MTIIQIYLLGNGEKQLETAKEPETLGKNQKKTDKNKDEKRMGAGMSPVYFEYFWQLFWELLKTFRTFQKANDDVQLGKNAKLEAMINRLLGENVEFDYTEMFGRFWNFSRLLHHF